MTMMHQRADTQQEAPQINLVPTRGTRVAAARMLTDLEERGGFDSVLRHADRIPADQWPALVAVILNTGRVGGRPPIRVEAFTADERRQAHAEYAAGDRTPRVIEAEREYQRLFKRQSRARGVV